MTDTAISGEAPTRPSKSMFWAAGALGIIATAVAAILPVLVGVWQKQAGLQVDQAGFVAATELLAQVAGTAGFLSASSFICGRRRCRRRPHTLCGGPSKRIHRVFRCRLGRRRRRHGVCARPRRHDERAGVDLGIDAADGAPHPAFPALACGWWPAGSGSVLTPFTVCWNRRFSCLGAHQAAGISASTSSASRLSDSCQPR